MVPDHDADVSVVRCDRRLLDGTKANWKGKNEEICLKMIEISFCAPLMSEKGRERRKGWSANEVAQVVGG